jgi:hypothetical protein
VKQAVVDVADLDTIVLTRNGKVVGHVEIRHRNNNIEFCGRAVNLSYRRYAGSGLETNNGFACGTSMQADDVIEIENADNFIKALAEVSK